VGGYSAIAVLFSDGFDTGDFSNWDGTNVDGSSEVSADAVVFHTGTHSAYIKIANFDHNAYAYKNFGNSDATVYARFYLYVQSFPADNGDQQQYANMKGTNKLWYVLGEKGASDTTLRCKYYTDGGAGYLTDYGALTLDTWYCIEVGMGVDDAAGWYTWWVDGVEIGTVTGIDSNYCGNPTEIRAGTEWWGHAETAEHNIDCVVVADERISCEGAAVTVPVMVHHYNRMKKKIGG